jgi:hypothetical protein
MVIPIDKQLTDLLEKRNFSRWTTAKAKVRRMSRLTRPSDCQICGKAIVGGQMYRDGGIHNRVHDTCVVGISGRD